MVVTRPVETSDLDSLLKLAELTGFGLTTLPRDRDLLAERVEDSVHSFRRSARRPRGESYLFVMEDLHGQTSTAPTSGRRVIGTCGIASKVGGFEPFYAYRVDRIPLFSAMLNVSKTMQTLTLQMEHNGPTEIGSLFLHPEFRSGVGREGNGRLLSLSRFLFIAEHATRFDSTVIAEMRGVIDDQGRSHFWDAVGKHFFEIDFPKADYLSMVNKQFIADLMPRHAIYVPLLPEAAQAVIGQVHPETRPALRLLESEGFRITNLVDIFEAGPVVEARREGIRSVRESVRAVVEELAATGAGAVMCHVLNVRESRSARGRVQPLSNGTVRIDEMMAGALRVEAGDVVRFAAARAEPTIGKAELP